MSVTYLPSFIERTYTQNNTETQCDKGMCTSIQSLCNLENDMLKCLQKYSIPNGLVVYNEVGKPMRKSTSHTIISDDKFDNLYNMLLLNTKSKHTVKKNEYNNQTRKKR